MRSLFSWIITIVLWFLIYWWECASGAFVAKHFVLQFIFTWVYLLSASILVLPYESKELHNKVFGGRLFILGPGFYFVPFIMWWGKVTTITQVPNVEERNFIHLDTRELADALKDYANRKVDRPRELKGFWGALEDFLRQYWSGKDIKDSIWIIVVTFFLAWFLSTYFLKFNKEYFPKNFTKKERQIYTPVINSSTSQKIDHAKVMRDYVDSVRSVTPDAEYYGDTTAPAISNGTEEYTESIEVDNSTTAPSKRIKHKRESRYPEETNTTTNSSNDVAINKPIEEFDVEKYVSNAIIVFIPHIILYNYPDYEIARYLNKGYTLFPQRNYDGSFVITNSFGSTISEMDDCFTFVFACKGKLFWSYNHRPFNGAMSQRLQNDINISLTLPEYVYIINARSFNFDGTRY